MPPLVLMLAGAVRPQQVRFGRRQCCNLSLGRVGLSS